MLRQRQKLAGFLHRIAQGAQRAAAQAHRLRRGNKGGKRNCCVHRRVEERIEMIVDEGMAAQCVQLPLAAVVAAENEERRGRAHPLLAHDRVEALAHGTVLDNDNVALLKIALCG